MIIKEMFKQDINRPINGVIQVEQEQKEVIKQEVQEYVITSELKKHFNHFFDKYSESFSTPTDNTGVWITGFFGSGKSHFLKMLSYLLENNYIKEKIGAIHHTGLGPDLLKRQTGPHCHCVGITPDKEFIFAVDLGADKVIMYSYKYGKLEESPNHNLNIVPGSGPRHMIFSKDGRFAYLVNEIANNIMVFKYYDKYFNLIQVIHTTPRHFHGFSSASAIRLSKSGKHLFVSNRGHNSIVLYRVNQETGKLTLLYMVHTGKNPRDFNILGDQYLIIGAQDDNEIELFTFNEEIEELVRTANTLAIPSPVCITIKEE